MRNSWVLGAIFVVGTTTSEARAADFRLEMGAAAAGTEWHGDAAAYAHLGLGFRFLDVIGVYAQGQTGYGIVDQRMLTLLALGAQAWTPPLGPVRLYGRLAFLHQHEESLSVVAGDFGSALFGIGNGIRHRAGLEAGLGLDIPFFTKNDFELFANVDGGAKIFPDDLGPKVYGGGGLGLGFHYAL